ncbi:MAG: thioredoxin family protein [Bdellovibrionales bacterium]|nr:thioredoxin family protein [Bdellovibrionales bacterium]
MAKTPSNMIDLGTPAPDFSLPDAVSGATVSLEDYASKQGVLVMFICNHCPFVIHVQEELVRLGQDFEGSALQIIAISSNDVANYPDDAPEKMKERAREAGYLFPYCYDESQQVAKAYGAACTPDFFLFDADRKLVYRGQLDGSRPGNDVPVTGHDLRQAIEAMLSGQQVSSEQQPSIGCNIKWR